MTISCNSYLDCEVHSDEYNEKLALVEALKSLDIVKHIIVEHDKQGWVIRGMVTELHGYLFEGSWSSVN